MSQAMQGCLEAAEVWFLRRMLSVSWMERMRNEAVLRKADAGRKLMIMITLRQIRFLGYVNGKETGEYLAMTGKIEGERARGRQRKPFMNSIIRRVEGSFGGRVFYSEVFCSTS